MIAPLLFNIFSAAVTNVACMRYKADKGIMDALVGLIKKAGTGVRGKKRPESLLRRRHYGARYTRTMPKSSRNYLISSGR